MLTITTLAERQASAEQMIKDAIWSVTYVPSDSIDFTKSLVGHYGLDQLDLTEMLMEIEDELGIDFEPKFFDLDTTFVTVQDLLDESRRLMT